VDAHGPRLESILSHCERHALLHMAPKWFDHWTTWAGHTISVVSTALCTVWRYGHVIQV